MENNDTQKMLIWAEIQDQIMRDNGCFAQYELNDKDGYKSIRVTTHNPKKQETFLLVEMACQNEIDGLKKVSTWIKNYNLSSEEFSHTIIWSKVGEGGKTYKSYFYAKNARKALDKFFYDKDEDAYIIYEVKINPVA